MTIEPATRQDIENLKTWILERETSWIKWVVGFQLTYFVVTIGVAFVTGYIK